ncbi:MAG: hypothetical protein ACFFCO_06945, partial [Promethearchaeota archaeon]
MPGGFREIREYDDGEEEKQERREKAEASLKAYDRYRKYFDDARRELRENSSSPKEAQESQARIEAILAEASRQAEENITPPTERLVEQQAPSVPPQERPLPERRVMSQDSTDPDTRETPEDPVDSQRPKPEPREQIFTLPQQEREQHSIHGAADSRVRRSIDSVEEYQQALHAFPDEAESPDFTELDYQVREFFSMRRNFPEGGPVEFIAGSTGIPAELVQKWMDGVERPEFLTKLEQRATREASMKEASEEKPDGVETVKFKPSAAEDRTSTLPASVREIVSDESDIEFLSRLSKNWDALHELGMTDTAFERIEEIASKHFRFTDSKYEILRATEDKELRTKLIPTKGTPLTKVVEATRTLVDDEATNQLLDKIKATKGKFTIDSWESYQLVLRALPLTLAEPNFEALHRVIKGRLLLGDCIGHTKAREYGRTEVTDKRVTYFTYTRKNLKAFEKIELFCNTHLEKIVKRHRRLGRSGIRTIEDVKEKLSRYYGGRQIFRLSSYPRELEFAKRTLVIYPLSRLGLRLPLLNKYDTEGIRIPRYILERSFLKRGFNKVLELAVLIPKKAPEKGWQWVELLRKPRGKENITARMGWIQIPVKVQSENISKVIEQLGIPTKPEEREKFFDILKEHGVSS